MTVYTLSVRGKNKAQNEDRFFADPERGLFVLADGGASHQAGGKAAELAVEIINSRVPGRTDREPDAVALLRECIRAANGILFRQSRQARELFGMGTTALVAWIVDDLCHIAHVGDSRAYLVREGRVEGLTEDHSVTGWLVRTGRISHDEIRHHRFRYALTRSVGTRAKVDVDGRSLRLEKKDFLLLCTDGLTDALEDGEMEEIFSQGQRVPENLCEELVKKAREKDDRDDTTVLLIAFG